MSIRLLALILALSTAVPTAQSAPDWLLNPSPFKARITKSKDGRELEFNNGLVEIPVTVKAQGMNWFVIE